MSLTSILAEERRLAILQTLEVAPGYELNEDTLRLALKTQARNVTHDVLRGDLAWLESQDLVRVQKLPVASGELWLGHLRPTGQDVVGGAPFPGVARPRAV